MMKQPYPLFDRAVLTLKPLKERTHDLDSGSFPTLDSPLPAYHSEELESLSRAVRQAKRDKAPVILAMGAHVIRAGVACYIIDLMKRGIIDHICFNGACAIHDYEIALAGATTESVARYIRSGEFGMWRETGYINDYLAEGKPYGYGFGQALGWAIARHSLPYRERSLLYHAYELGIPVTVHVGIGCDIIHQHPNCDGAMLGDASYRDFLIFTQAVTKLEHGVYLSAGTAVMGPEVFLKALSMARNAQYSVDHITTAVFDIYPLPREAVHSQPDKGDFRYYFRPWKTLLVRTVGETGKSFYIQGRHEETFPHLHALLKENNP